VTASRFALSGLFAGLAISALQYAALVPALRQVGLERGQVEALRQHAAGCAAHERRRLGGHRPPIPFSRCGLRGGSWHEAGRHRPGQLHGADPGRAAARPPGALAGLGDDLRACGLRGDDALFVQAAIRAGEVEQDLRVAAFRPDPGPVTATYDVLGEAVEVRSGWWSSLRSAGLDGWLADLDAGATPWASPGSRSPPRLCGRCARSSSAPARWRRSTSPCRRWLPPRTTRRGERETGRDKPRRTRDAARRTL